MFHQHVPSNSRYDVTKSYRVARTAEPCVQSLILLIPKCRHGMLILLASPSVCDMDTVWLKGLGGKRKRKLTAWVTVAALLRSNLAHSWWPN